MGRKWSTSRAFHGNSPTEEMNAQLIYSVLLDWLKKKGLQCSKLIGMGFDGATTFAGKKSGVQAHLKKHAPHSVFVNCHCHKLQLACVQSANRTEGIKHVYTTLTTLWKNFHYSPKRCLNLKEIQKVLDIPELKIVKPFDTRWLSHEKCVYTVKKCYGAIMSAFETIYQESHDRRHSVLARSYRSPLHCLPYISLTTFSLRYPS